jgi:histidinol dehydrogenase
VVLLCSSGEILESVSNEIAKILETLPRADIASKALANSLGIVMEDKSEMIGFSNLYAPEHLIISLENAGEIAEEVVNAGSVFVGNYSPESAGDYASGTNHTLPTNAFARSYSGLNLQSFMKTIQFQELSTDGISGIGNDIINMARAEGLDGHSLAVELRLKKLGDDKI